MKLGVQLFSLRKYLKVEADYHAVFERVKNLGADVVQISATMSQGAADPSVLAAASKEFELPICVTHSPFDRIKDDLDGLAAEHLLFGCKDIGIGMMPKEFRENDFEKLDDFIQIFNTSAEKLDKYGMHIAYHNHGFEFGKRGNDTVFDILINETAKDVRFIPDTFWIKVGGLDPAEFLGRLDGRVDTLHLKDYEKIFGVPLFRTPGKGKLDFKEILSAAERIGVENAVIELDISPNPWKSIESGMRYIKSISYQ